MPPGAGRILSLVVGPTPVRPRRACGRARGTTAPVALRKRRVNGSDRQSLDGPVISDSGCLSKRGGAASLTLCLTRAGRCSDDFTSSDWLMPLRLLRRSTAYCCPRSALILHSWLSYTGSYRLLVELVSGGDMCCNDCCDPRSGHRTNRSRQSGSEA